MVAVAWEDRRCPEDDPHEAGPSNALTRLILQAVLMRPVVPLLARATVIPVSATTSSSLVVAPVTTLGASTEASFANGSEFLTVAGVMGVQVVEGTERSVALG